MLCDESSKVVHIYIYIQGRRWGGRIKIAFNVVKNVYYQGSIYDAQPTFESYGVAHGDRAGLSQTFPCDDLHFAVLLCKNQVHLENR
jgi:hypothetical protein